MLEIRLSKPANESGGVAKPPESVTVACPDHLVIAELPVAKSLGTVNPASQLKTVGRRSRRQLGERVHFCVRCDFPIAVYGRLAILTEAFGESSDSEGEEEEEFLHAHSAEYQVNRKALSGSVFGESHSWERISEIDGLWLCKDFLSPDQQSKLLSSIQQEGWFAESSSNQAMRFGDLPGWAVELSSSIHEMILLGNYAAELENCEKDKEARIFPQDLLWREPLFDQLIANMYQPGNLSAC